MAELQLCWLHLAVMVLRHPRTSSSPRVLLRPMAPPACTAGTYLPTRCPILAYKPPTRCPVLTCDPPTHSLCDV
eukprot:86821-Rhodomonas_salina.1